MNEIEILEGNVFKDIINTFKNIFGTSKEEVNESVRNRLQDVLKVARDIGSDKSISNLEKNIDYVGKLKKKLVRGLLKYDIHMNSNDLCVNNIINFSLMKFDNKLFLHLLEKENIFVSTTTACCGKNKSVVLNEIYKDDIISKTCIRISLSHLNKMQEVNEFLKVFDKLYNKK